MTSDPIVYVVDDDSSVLESLSRLLRSEGLIARCFPDAQDFLALNKSEDHACLLMDLHLPKMNGSIGQYTVESQSLQFLYKSAVFFRSQIVNRFMPEGMPVYGEQLWQKQS